jgi:hypothetical protein
MMNHLRTFALTGALVIGASIASANASAQQQPATTAPAAVQPQEQQAPAAERRRAPRARRDVISREELAASGTTNLYEAVQRLRPGWLRGGSASNLGGGGQGYVVYQDNARLGGLDALRQVSIEFAEELRFLDGPTATNTLPGLGSQRVSGAIVVARPRGN